MKIELTNPAKKDLEYWKKTGNKKILKRIRELLNAIVDTPFDGIGKPEPLKHQLSGKWSRRINRENRLIYAVSKQTLYVYSLRGHYWN